MTRDPTNSHLPAPAPRTPCRGGRAPIRVPAARTLLEVCAAVVAIFAAAPHPARATDFTTFGPGPRAIAMGGAFTAVADDFTGGFYNPGALLTSTKTRVGLGYQYEKFVLEANGDNLDRNHTYVDGLWLGFAFPLPFIDWLKDRVAIGYNLYQPVNYVLDIQIPQASIPQFVILESYARANAMNLSVGTDAIPGVGIGAGATFSSDLGGSLDIRPGIRGMLGQPALIGQVDQEVQPVIKPLAGILFQPGKFWESAKGLQVAFTWHDEFYINLQIPVTVILGTIPLKLDFVSTFIYTPENLNLGVSYRVNEDILVSTEIGYRVWSEYRVPTLSIETDIDIPLLPLELLPGVPEAPHFRDTWNPRVGAEWCVARWNPLDLTLRGGYAFEPTPVPEQTGWSNFLDGDKHLFSAGAAFAVKRFFGYDLAETPPTLNFVFQWQHESETKSVKSAEVRAIVERESAEGADPAELQPGYPEITGQADAFLFGFALTVEYGGS